MGWYAAAMVGTCDAEVADMGGSEEGATATAAAAVALAAADAEQDDEGDETVVVERGLIWCW